jgi:predicted transcriptional regulator
MSQIAQREHIGAYVDADQRKQLIELARRDDRSVSSVIRQALKAHVEREAPAVPDQAGG